jgi:hypothetical protein
MGELRKPTASSAGRQLLMALDAPRLRGLSGEERRATVAALAILLVEAAAVGGGDDGR